MNPANPKNMQEYSDRSLRPVAPHADRLGKIELFLTTQEREEIARRNPTPHNLAQFVREVIDLDFAGLLPVVKRVRQPHSESYRSVPVRMPRATVQAVQGLAQDCRMTASDYLVNRLLARPLIERPDGFVSPARRRRRILDQAGRKEVALVRIAKALAVLSKAVSGCLATGYRDRALRQLDRMAQAIESIKEQEGRK